MPSRLFLIPALLAAFVCTALAQGPYSVDWATVVKLTPQDDPMQMEALKPLLATDGPERLRGLALLYRRAGGRAGGKHVQGGMLQAAGSPRLLKRR